MPLTARCSGIMGNSHGTIIITTFLPCQEDVKETRAGSGSRAKQDYWGALVLVNADDQSFDTVMAAINSSRCASCDVTLVVERKKGSPSEVKLMHYASVVAPSACLPLNIHTKYFVIQNSC